MPASTPPPIQQRASATPRFADSDAGLSECIQHLSAEQLRALKAEAKATGMPNQLRAMTNCVEQFALRSK